MFLAAKYLFQFSDEELFGAAASPNTLDKKLQQRVERDQVLHFFEEEWDRYDPYVSDEEDSAEKRVGTSDGSAHRDAEKSRADLLPATEKDDSCVSRSPRSSHDPAKKLGDGAAQRSPEGASCADDPPRGMLATSPGGEGDAPRAASSRDSHARLEQLRTAYYNAVNGISHQSEVIAELIEADFLRWKRNLSRAQKMLAELPNARRRTLEEIGRHPLLREEGRNFLYLQNLLSVMRNEGRGKYFKYVGGDCLLCRVYLPRPKRTFFRQFLPDSSLDPEAATSFVDQRKEVAASGSREESGRNFRHFFKNSSQAVFRFFRRPPLRSWTSTCC